MKKRVLEAMLEGWAKAGEMLKVDDWQEEGADFFLRQKEEKIGILAGKCIRVGFEFGNKKDWSSLVSIASEMEFLEMGLLAIRMALNVNGAIDEEGGSKVKELMESASDYFAMLAKKPDMCEWKGLGEFSR